MNAILTPRVRAGRLRRIRKDFFGSPASALMTLASAAVILALAWRVIDWAVLNATFSASGTQAICAERSGA